MKKNVLFFLCLAQSELNFHHTESQLTHTTTQSNPITETRHNLTTLFALGLSVVGVSEYVYAGTCTAISVSPTWLYMCFDCEREKLHIFYNYTLGDVFFYYLFVCDIFYLNSTLDLGDVMSMQ